LKDVLNYILFLHIYTEKLLCVIMTLWILEFS